MKYDYDVLIIGGGITGACIVWDATLRGVKCILLEKNDFASGTSQATSKLIHGGLRYLKNFELGLVRESLRERRNLARITPHSIYTLGFAVPVYSYKEMLLLWAGMELYNLLSWDRNDGVREDSLIPRYSFWNRKRVIHELPRISRSGIKGAYLYYDYANLNPERHTTEFLFSAKAKGAEVRNYTEVTGIEKKSDSQGYVVQIQDKLTGKSQTLLVRAVVNASGPWADILESKAGIPVEKNITRSKGIHIITRKICGEHSIVLSKRDGTHLFVIPWRGKTIIGTTDTVYEGHPDDFRVTRKDIEELLDEVNFAYGETQLTLSDIDFYYGGLRPLVEDSENTGSSYNASRKSEIIDHSTHGFPGFFSALGGKYTTSRAVAESLVDKLTEFLPGSYSPCITSKAPLLGGMYDDFRSLAVSLQKRYPHANGKKIETLIHRYGSLAEEVLELGNSPLEDPDCFRLSGGELLYPEEVKYIARNEMVVYASDFFFRRSGAGVPGKPDSESLEGILKILAIELGWNAIRFQNERELVLSRYKLPE